MVNNFKDCYVQIIEDLIGSVLKTIWLIVQSEIKYKMSYFQEGQQAQAKQT